MVIADIDTYEYMFEIYRANEEFEYTIQNSITESILESSVLLEGQVWEAIKAFFARIVEAIQRLWYKFTNFIKEKHKDDVKIYTTYKDIILKGKVRAGTLENWHDYDIEKLKKPLADWDESKVSEYCKELEEELTEKHKSKSDFKQDKDTIRKRVIHDYFPDYEPDTSDSKKPQTFEEKVRLVLAGTGRNIESKDLPMQKMYDYVMDYPKFADTIQSETNKIKDIPNTFERVFENVKNGFAKLFAKFGTKRDTTTPNTSEESTKDTKESAYMSMMNYYFNEADDSPAGSMATSNNTTTADTKDKEPSLGTIVINDKKDKDTSNNDGTKDINDTDTDKEKAKAEKRLENMVSMAYKQWGSLASSFIGIRMNIAKDAYNDYKKVLRWHIDCYIEDNNLDKEKIEKANEPEKKESETKDKNKLKEEV